METATERVAEFESVMENHRDAMDCFDCESFLRLGIEAHRWLSTAERHIIARASKGYPAPEVHEAMHSLFNGWLKTSQIAQIWIDRVSNNGFNINGLEEFYEAREAVVGWLDCYERSREAISSWDAW